MFAIVNRATGCFPLAANHKDKFPIVGLPVDHSVISVLVARLPNKFKLFTKAICLPLVYVLTPEGDIRWVPGNQVLHYANISVQYIAIFQGCKNDYFQMKIFDFFLIFAQNIDCGYTLEPVLTSTHNLCFGAKIRKKMYTPVNPSFTI